ncbi:MAG: hypothetical protein R8M45_07135 [Ghiorsea sp.]
MNIHDVLSMLKIKAKRIVLQTITLWLDEQWGGKREKGLQLSRFF